MYPFFTVSGIDVPLYTLMAVIGLLVAGFWFCRSIKKAGYDDNDAVIFLLVLAVGMYLGGMILYAITNARHFPKLFAAEDFTQFKKIAGAIFGGSVFYGGLLGACGTGYLWVRIKKLPLEVYLDRCAFFAPLFHAFARVGCFFAGCCYGIEGAFGLAVPESVETVTAIGHVSRFPVQLLEALCNLGIACLILFLLQKGRMRGKLLYVYFGLYAILRFCDEFLRGDEIRGFVGVFSTSQFISLFIGAFAAFMLFIKPRLIKNKNQTI